MLNGYKTVIFQFVMLILLFIKTLAPDANLPDEQTINQGIDTVLLALGLVWAFGSIVFRHFRAIVDRLRGRQSGEAGVGLIILLCLTLGLTVALAGCAPGASQTTVQQLHSQGVNDPFVLSQGAYLDARIWYNQAQRSFLEYAPTLTDAMVTEYNNALNDIGKALDMWGFSLGLKTVREGDEAAFKKARDEMIDLGFKLLTK